MEGVVWGRWSTCGAVLVVAAGDDGTCGGADGVGGSSRIGGGKGQVGEHRVCPHEGEVKGKRVFVMDCAGFWNCN